MADRTRISTKQMGKVMAFLYLSNVMVQMGTQILMYGATRERTEKFQVTLLEMLEAVR